MRHTHGLPATRCTLPGQWLSNEQRQALERDEKFSLDCYSTLEPAVCHLGGPSYFVEHVLQDVSPGMRVRIHGAQPSYAHLALALSKEQCKLTAAESGRCRFRGDDTHRRTVPCVAMHATLREHQPLRVRGAWLFADYTYYMVTILGTHCVYTTFLWDSCFRRLGWALLDTDERLAHMPAVRYEPTTYFSEARSPFGQPLSGMECGPPWLAGAVQHALAMAKPKPTARRNPWTVVTQWSTADRLGTLKCRYLRVSRRRCFLVASTSMAWTDTGCALLRSLRFAARPT